MSTSPKVSLHNQWQSRRLAVCLLGAGRMGSLRAPLLFANPDIDLRIVVDKSKTARQKIASRFGVSVDGDLSKALSEHPEVCAVFISTPTFTHISSIREVISIAKGRLGGRGYLVFVEKPVAEDPVKIAQIFEEASCANVKILCGFQRRFDVSYCTAQRKVAEGDIGMLRSARIFFADHPLPSMEFLASGGDPFMDLAPHDLDYVRWVVGAEPLRIWAQGSSSNQLLASHGVYDNAGVTIEFTNGVVCTMFMSRGATYGYDQRAEFFGSEGIVAVENERESTVIHGNTSGLHQSRLRHSFPQRFHSAFAAEVAAVVAVFRGQYSWPVTVKDCVAAQSIAMAASRSAASGSIVEIDCSLWNHLSKEIDNKTEGEGSSVSVRPLGCGNFGSYIQQIVGVPGSVPGLRLMSPFTPRVGGYEAYEKQVLNDDFVDATYICSPDKFHLVQAIDCLRAGKHVLVEKPVYPDFEKLQQILRVDNDKAVTSASKTSVQIMMVGFHRRFAKEFQRARSHIMNLPKSPRYIVVRLSCWSVPCLDPTINLGVQAMPNFYIESRDPVPEDPSHAFVLWNSCSHDIDMIRWLLPTCKTFKFVTGSTGSASAIQLNGVVELENKNKIKIVLQYSKCHRTYVQHVKVDGITFGYEWDPDLEPAGAQDQQNCCSIYKVCMRQLHNYQTLNEYLFPSILADT